MMISEDKASSWKVDWNIRSRSRAKIALNSQVRDEAAAYPLNNVNASYMNPVGQRYSFSTLGRSRRMWMFRREPEIIQLLHPQDTKATSLRFILS
jgi:hypothetical protein